MDTLLYQILMIYGEICYWGHIDIMTWYDKYTGLTYKHLGDDLNSGIDCFNLIKVIYKVKLNIELPYSTSDFCDDNKESWYCNSDNTKFINPFTEFANPDRGWNKVKDPRIFDVAIMTLGSTNIINHCALFVESNKILNIMIEKKSWVTNYSRYYRQYTDGIYRYNKIQ